jgi:hypothetical protein
MTAKHAKSNDHLRFTLPLALLGTYITSMVSIISVYLKARTRMDCQLSATNEKVRNAARLMIDDIRYNHFRIDRQ